ncbi:hypothetical protein NDU88_000643 [Pleurodeles waltl]|uniref:Uncharacterized protein n=1 Tax=Pleurodeles waltl TaxID=8319 RepID=A0AAV7NBY0_PLEWA|nr:hypothetical protein NDU88_000643 [Pleurodeles waltl]
MRPRFRRSAAQQPPRPGAGGRGGLQAAGARGVGLITELEQKKYQRSQVVPVSVTLGLANKCRHGGETLAVGQLKYRRRLRSMGPLSLVVTQKTHTTLKLRA